MLRKSAARRRLAAGAKMGKAIVPARIVAQSFPQYKSAKNPQPKIGCG
jgi:hypothetical protein